MSFVGARRVGPAEDAGAGGVVRRFSFEEDWVWFVLSAAPFVFRFSCVWKRFVLARERLFLLHTHRKKHTVPDMT